MDSSSNKDLYRREQVFSIGIQFVSRSKASPYELNFIELNEFDQIDQSNYLQRIDFGSRFERSIHSPTRDCFALQIEISSLRSIEILLFRLNESYRNRGLNFNRNELSLRIELNRLQLLFELNRT